MRRTFFTLVIGVFVCFLFSISLSGQQNASPPALSYLQRSLSQLEGNASISDVTLTGSVRRVAGSDDESGTATFKALLSGAARADLSLSSGIVSEIYNSSGPEPSGAWSGPDRTLHAIAFHNLPPSLPGSSPLSPSLAGLLGFTLQPTWGLNLLMATTPTTFPSYTKSRHCQRP